MISAHRYQPFAIDGEDCSEDPIRVILHLPHLYARGDIKYANRLVGTSVG